MMNTFFGLRFDMLEYKILLGFALFLIATISISPQIYAQTNDSVYTSEQTTVSENLENDPMAQMILKKIEQTKNEFDNALESDFNTHLALSAFFKLVKETNRISAETSLGKLDSEKIMTEFERMLDILGLDIPKISREEKEKIDSLIIKREELRKEKQFEEADKIRDKINEMNVELIDHKGKTIWVRKEKIKGE